MNIIFAILFIMSIILLTTISLCVIGFALLRKDIIYHKRTQFIQSRYCDFTFFKRNEAVYKFFKQKPWDDIGKNL